MAVTSAKVTILDPATGQITIVAEDADIFGTGTLAARPAAGSGNGDMYVVNDPLGTYQIDLWDGAVWRTLGPDATVSTGNTLWVDAVNGNNGTAVSGRLDLPYLTIAAALAAAVSDDLVYVLPGSYDETSLVIPDDVTLAGIDRLRCVISHTSLAASTVVTMGANTSLENLTIEGGSPVSPSGRTLVSFPATTSSTSVARNLLLSGTVNNVNGVSVSGTGTSAHSWVTADMVDVKGVGISNGLISSSSGFFIVRDCVCSGLVGVTVGSGSIELQDTKCQGFTGLSISVGATCYVNLATRWLGTTPLANSGTLLDAGENLYTNVGGDLSGTMPDPAVAAITETTGPTQLVIGAIADGQFLTRSGATLIGAAGGGGISGPGASVDRGVVVWDGLTGTAIDDAGIRNYGLSATDPAVPAPADGDFYVNSVLDMAMLYDGTRAKWLSVETVEIPFNRNGNTGGGAFYRMGNRAMSGSLGRTAEWDGTVVSISYTRQDVDLATFEVIADGVTSLATLASSAISGTTLTADGDFSQGDILGVKNQTGSNTTRHVVGFARIKWRAT